MGTVGHWDGSADRDPLGQNRSGWAALKVMGTDQRRAVIDQTLSSLSSVSLSHSTSANTEGHIGLAGQTIVTLKKPTTTFLKEKQLPWLRTYSDLRSDRLNEIIMQTGDIQSFFALVGYMAPEATKWTLCLNQAIYRLCNLLEMPLKHGFDVARPIAMSSKVQPVIQTPPHGAWPSGHATEAFASATLLTRLFFDRPFDPAKEIADGNPLYRHAERIAMNRTIAGVHFPTDSMAGAVLGVTLAEGLIRLLDGASETPTRLYHGESYPGDFTLAALSAAFEGEGYVTTGTAPLDGTLVPAWLRDLWAEAKAEW
ncbi:phosphatase PAP2 family protein [Sagittula sp. SSi028]|uniref:phosphatase PAP2 family protein n=1 Tax=Sagittula sp. SSi028 TaxID=3400636 RepID=UPI003AF45002